MAIEFKYADLKAPRKVFKKDKETGDIRHLTRIAFDVAGIDDETLMMLTAFSDGGQVSVAITLGALGPPPRP